MNIDWQSEESHIMINPRWSNDIKDKIQQYSEMLYQKKSIIWISTSGSTSNRDVVKLIGLSKPAFLASAQSVNNHIKSTSDDVWLKVLPSFHVGGLSILARAYLSAARINESKELHWGVAEFIEELAQSHATIVSLVPTQVYDLVKQNITCPKSLRVVFVGGGSISPELYKKAIQLKWPLILTYGMTEACSQVATSRLADIFNTSKPPAQILPHLKVKISSDRLIQIKGSSMLNFQATISSSGIQLREWKKNDFFTTSDFGELDTEGNLKCMGRESDVVKVLGELVNLTRLNSALTNTSGVICALPDKRTENKLVFVATIDELHSYERVLANYNQRVLPFERVSEVYIVKRLPVTYLNKLKLDTLKAYLLSQ